MGGLDAEALHLGVEGASTDAEGSGRGAAVPASYL
jgi:hypothetical protein